VRQIEIVPLRAPERCWVERPACGHVAIERQARRKLVDGVDPVLEETPVAAPGDRDVLGRHGIPEQPDGIALAVQGPESVLQRADVALLQLSVAEDLRNALLDGLAVEVSLLPGALQGVVAGMEKMAIGIPDTQLVSQASMRLLHPPDGLQQVV
jgi:hypothetical protein